MSLKPIDLQTSMNQIIEVGRNEHAKAAAIADMQHVRSTEASEKSRMANSKLDDSQKGEKASIKEKDHRRSGHSGHHGAGDDKSEETTPEESLKDDRAGRIIDIKR